MKSDVLDLDEDKLFRVYRFTPVFLDKNGKNIAISYQTSTHLQDNPSFFLLVLPCFSNDLEIPPP